MLRWRRVVLPASIILNFFFAALIGGHLWQTQREEIGFGIPLARALRNAEAILTPQDAAAFSAVMRRDAPQYLESARQLREARQELRRQITADHVSQEEVRQALATWQTAWDHFVGDVRGPLAEALAQVSPEGRRKLIAERRAVEADPSSP